MRSIVVLPLLLLATMVAFAQETDYAPGPRHASLTIFDEIDDPVERESFRAAWNAKEPRAKRDLADAFAERYARSIVLREAYELSARASAEIGDHPAALERAQRSLRLLPENPFLLVMTADLAAKQSAFDLADTSARDALRYLANADTPWPVTADAWPRVRDQLRSTAYFVLGRVAAMRGAYTDARRSLLMSLSLNHDEIDALYTLGVVQAALGDDAGAATSFAHVMRTSRALAGPARESLQSLYAKQRPASKSFEDYAASLTWTPPTPAVRASSPPAGAYAGSESCRDCHSPIYERWRATGMSKMFRSYRAADVVGDFSSGHVVDASARPVMQDGRHFIDIRKGDSSEWIRYPVDYLIGSKWQQAYATRLPDARILVFPIQYQPQTVGMAQLLGRGGRPGIPAHGHFAFSYDSRRRDLPDVLRAVSYEPTERDTRKPRVVRGVRADGTDIGTRRDLVSRSGHQLRDVPWTVTRSHRAHQVGRRRAGDLRHAGELPPPAGRAIRRGLQSVSRAIGGAQRG